jgi:hypothetical protein
VKWYEVILKYLPEILTAKAEPKKEEQAEQPDQKKIEKSEGKEEKKPKAKKK